MKSPKQPVRRVNRLESKAQKQMGKAQKTWTKAEAIRKNFTGTQNEEAKYDRLMERATRQGDRAKNKVNRASYLRDKSGMAPSPIKSQSKSKSIEASKGRKRGM